VTVWPALALVVSALLAAPPAPSPAAPVAPAADPLAPFAPLLGEWDGEPTGQPGAPVRARASFTRELDGKVVVRRNRVEYPPAAGGGAGAVHEDLLVIGPEGGALRATYWDNEGHVIRYAVSAAGGAVTFESEAGPGPRFRLAYQPLPDGRWSVTFSMAPPGGEFRPLQAGTMRRPARKD
jgi:hypothetical protein